MSRQPTDTARSPASDRGAVRPAPARGRPRGKPAADRPDHLPLFEKLGRVITNAALIDAALVHPSAIGRSARAAAGGATFERLEFLGDRVLGLVIAQALLERFPDEPEGDIARRHAALVRRESLEHVANDIGLMTYLRQAGAAQKRDRVAVMADAMEALIAALYLDGGLPAADGFIRRAWAGMIEAPPAPPQDAKTGLQEWAQARSLPLPLYEVVASAGPAHAPTFTVRVTVDGTEPAEGNGRSKRAAEQEAAGRLLARLRPDRP